MRLVAPFLVGIGMPKFFARHPRRNKARITLPFLAGAALMLAALRAARGFIRP